MNRRAGVVLDVPIARGYVTAHYLTLLILEGQRVFIAFSDPLSLGLDLFGTAGRGINASIVNYPGLIGSIQTAAIVVGHILGVILVHGLRCRVGVGDVGAHRH